MFIFLERKTFQGFDPNKLTLLYPSCRASYNDSHISLRTSLNDCGTTHNESEDAITFYNKVRSVQSYSGNIITREQNVSIPFYCSYGRKALLRNPSFKTWKNHFTASEGNLLQGNAHLITSVLRYTIDFITTRVIVQFNEFISFKGKHSLNKPFLKKKKNPFSSSPCQIDGTPLAVTWYCDAILRPLLLSRTQWAFRFCSSSIWFSVDTLIVPNNHQGWVIHDVYRS